jgi:transposase
MQEKDFDLKKRRTTALPVIDHVLGQIGLRAILLESMKNERYVDAIIALIKSVLLARSALYRVGEWAAAFDPALMPGGPFNDDLLARALDRLYAVDRASLQTRTVLAAIKRFGIDTSTIHNDSTSVSFDGAYVSQDKRAVQLKRGHSKDHRPDLKQLVYSLSVAGDEAVPVHFKTYDGNTTDDTTHQETWLSLRGLLGKSDFLYVADAKLCTTENMTAIDRNQGRFITIVPRTRKETETFADAVVKSEVRWKPLWRKRSRRRKAEDDCFELADGLWQLSEGFRLYWYKSSEKTKRDAESRIERINETLAKLVKIAAPGRRGPKSQKALLKAANKAIERRKATKWVIPEVTIAEEKIYKKLTPGRVGSDATFRLVMKKHATLKWRLDEDGIARSKAMDGIFPLTTNAELDALDVLKHYKYQPRLEKRFAFLKTVTCVAPVFLKKNERVESLMFVYFLATLVAALAERGLRRAMKEAGLDTIATLPEERPTATPTWEQLTRLFEGQARYDLMNGTRAVKAFYEPMNANQELVLRLLGVSDSAYR